MNGIHPYRTVSFSLDQNLSIVLQKIQFSLRMKICKALTYEIIVQFDKAFDMYTSAVEEFENLIQKLQEIIEDEEITKPVNTNETIKLLEDCTQILRERLKHVVDQSYKCSYFQSKVFLQNLGIIPKGFGPLKIENLKSTKEIFRERKVKRSAMILNASTSLTQIKSVPIGPGLDDEIIFPNIKFTSSQNLLDDLTTPQNEFSNGKVNEVFSTDVFQVFQIFNNSVTFLYENCKTMIYEYIEENSSYSKLRWHPKYYLLVGNAFCPLIKDATLFTKARNLYVFPDLSEDLKYTFIGLEFESGNPAIKDFDAILSQQTDLVVTPDAMLVSKKETKHDTYGTGVSSLEELKPGFCGSIRRALKRFIKLLPKISFVEMVEENNDSCMMDDSKNPLKIKCLGEIVSGMGLLLPTQCFSIDNHTLNVKDCCKSNNVVDDAWNKLFDVTYQTSLDFDAKMSEAIAAFWEFVVANKIEHHSHGTNPIKINRTYSYKNLGLTNMLVNSALVTFFICRSIKGSNYSSAVEKLKDTTIKEEKLKTEPLENLIEGPVKEESQPTDSVRKVSAITIIEENLQEVSVKKELAGLANKETLQQKHIEKAKIAKIPVYKEVVDASKDKKIE